ncbi:MAG TPA: hypothetical protein VHS53_04490 [Mucilaginibacter sp.]|nr:hypothetical protein [Mucilaginibacter sp.]
MEELTEYANKIKGFSIEKYSDGIYILYLIAINDLWAYSLKDKILQRIQLHYLENSEHNDSTITIVLWDSNESITLNFEKIDKNKENINLLKENMVTHLGYAYPDKNPNELIRLPKSAVEFS